ncbi:MAG: hypothetical protein HXX11_06300 [Desulfuromonadales bacterium]|nr:hypothetical protein [Desulfuromonadales bacterium]NVN90198.1 hypothetical protein [Desulfuromonadales bacterium]
MCPTKIEWPPAAHQGDSSSQPDRRTVTLVAVWIIKRSHTEQPGTGMTVDKNGTRQPYHVFRIDQGHPVGIVSEP